MAQQCTMDTLEQLEAEDLFLPHSAAEKTQLQKASEWNKNHTISRRNEQPTAFQRRISDKRTSVWINELTFDVDRLPDDFRLHTWGDGASSSLLAKEPYHLL